MGLELREWRAEFPRWVEEGEISESRVACEASLHEYLRQAWPNFESVKFVDGFHIGAICEHLEAVSFGQIKRLIINIPPRHAKPVWEEEWVVERDLGQIKLKDVQVGHYVLTHKGRFRRVLAVYEQGELPLVKIRTWTWREVRAAADHPFLTPAGWKNAGELRPGSRVVIVHPEDPCGVTEEVTSVDPGEKGVCRCLTVEEDSSFTANNFAVHNTSIVSIAWPTWTWVRRNDPKNNLVGPRVKFLCASYAAGKAQQDAVTARRLIGTKWYQDRWGKRVKITRDRDNQEQYDVEAGGYRISTGIPESLGKGGLIRIIDDPHKTGDVESEAVIEKQVRDYNEVWRTRTNDPLGGAEVIIMQRLGEADLTGYLLESEDDQDIVHLCLPALYDPVYHCSTPIGWSDPRTVKDESLWPERHPVEWYQTQKRRIGSFAFAGQYQQLPAPRGGGIIQREWWQLWPPVGEEKTWGGHWPSFYYVCAYLDTAFTSKDTNAWCALTVFGVFTYRARTRVAMIAGWRERPTLVGLVTKTRETCEKWKVDNLIIENKAGAEWVRQEIQKQMDKRSIKFTITLDEPTGDKVARARAVSAQFEEKMIYAPDKEWADMVIKEVENFPKGRWKDLTDTVTGAIGFLRRSNILEMDVDAEEREATQDVWGGRRETVAERYGL